LRALQEHPEAFLSSYEEEHAAPEVDRERLAACEGRNDRFVLCAFDGEDPVGMAGGLRVAAHHAKGRHRALIWGVYVAPEARGQGLGKRLMEEAVGILREADGIAVIQLGVGTYNTHARAVYASVGFETYGIEKRSIRLGDRWIDEELMALYL
jgi:ribosomal protein S18 acetylase RimI-like enzyme